MTETTANKDTKLLADSMFEQLGGLFAAIISSGDAGSQAKKLSEIGLYLCEDWSENLQAEITACSNR